MKKKRRTASVKIGFMFTLTLFSLAVVSVSYTEWSQNLHIQGTVNTLEDFNYIHLEGWWKLDEGSGQTAYDSSANDNTGTVHGATWTNGKINGGLSFDGINDYVEVADDDTLDISNEITIMAWVKPSRMGDYESFVHKDDAYVLQFAPGTDGYLRGALWLPSLTMLDDTTTQLSTNVWYHVALTYDGSQMRLYVNGSEVANRAATGGITTNDNPLYIGYNPRGVTYWFNGVMDEVKVYDHALTLEEIQQEYQKGL